MPPPQGIPLARHLPWSGSRSTAPECLEEAGEPPPAERRETEHRRGEDRRPLLWLWVKEANKRSAFNRRSRGEGL
jgi:hypothetical protein